MAHSHSHISRMQYNKYFHSPEKCHVYWNRFACCGLRAALVRFSIGHTALKPYFPTCRCITHIHTQFENTKKKSDKTTKKKTSAMLEMELVPIGCDLFYLVVLKPYSFAHAINTSPNRLNFIRNAWETPPLTLFIFMIIYIYSEVENVLLAQWKCKSISILFAQHVLTFFSSIPCVTQRPQSH